MVGAHSRTAAKANRLDLNCLSPHKSLHWFKACPKTTEAAQKRCGWEPQMPASNVGGQLRKGAGRNMWLLWEQEKILTLYLPATDSFGGQHRKKHGSKKWRGPHS